MLLVIEVIAVKRLKVGSPNHILITKPWRMSCGRVFTKDHSRHQAGRIKAQGGACVGLGNFARRVASRGTGEARFQERSTSGRQG